jgi:hypothetical protein
MEAIGPMRKRMNTVDILHAFENEVHEWDYLVGLSKASDACPDLLNTLERDRILARLAELRDKMLNAV